MCIFDTIPLFFRIISLLSQVPTEEWYCSVCSERLHSRAEAVAAGNTLNSSSFGDIKQYCRIEVEAELTQKLRDLKASGTYIPDKDKEVRLSTFISYFLRLCSHTAYITFVFRFASIVGRVSWIYARHWFTVRAERSLRHTSPSRNPS